jgi:hypothetical protein
LDINWVNLPSQGLSECIQGIGRQNNGNKSLSKRN